MVSCGVVKCRKGKFALVRSWVVNDGSVLAGDLIRAILLGGGCGRNKEDFARARCWKFWEFGADRVCFA